MESLELRVLDNDLTTFGSSATANITRGEHMPNHFKKIGPAATALAISLLGLAPTSGMAQSEPTIGGCPSYVFNNYSGSYGEFYSVACFYGQVATGLSDYMLVPSSSTSYGEIDHNTWMLSGSPCNSWAEVDLANGGNGPQLIWNMVYTNSSGVQETAGGGNLGSVSPGQTYGAEILYSGGTSWQVWVGYDEGTYFSWVYEGTNSIPLGEGGCKEQTGLEELGQPGSYPVNGNQYASTATSTDISWLDTSNHWHLGFPESESYAGIAWPCGTSWNGQTLSPPDCLNGSYYNNGSEWADNHLG